MPETPRPGSPATAPPRPDRRPIERTHHGRTVVDPYAWLADPDDPAVIAHLEAENAWTEAATAHLAARREELYDEIRRRTQETDLSVPARDGDWWYFQRTEEGRSYPVHCRTPDDGTHRAPVTDPAAEQVVLDLDALAVDGGYLGLGVLDVSPDGHLLAWAIDREGDERHRLRFRDLRTGEDLDEEIAEVAYGFAWAADSRTCWYVVQDEACRPHRVFRHVAGTDPTDDVEVFRDDDERFHLSVAPSRSGAVAVITAGSAITSESWLLDAHRPELAPEEVAAREDGVEYSLAHHPTGLLIVSNHGGAEDFALWRAPLDGIRTGPREAWEPVVAHRPGLRLLGVEAFRDHAVLHGREDGATAIWLLDPTSGERSAIEPDGAVGTLAPGANPSYDADTYRFSYQSLAVPPSVVELDLATGAHQVLKQLPVLDGFDASRYETAREWATAPDGTRVPISLVWRPDAVPATGPAPCVLYGYGAYEASMDPWFSIARLSLLDQGVVFAVAHVRGGGELGRRWYEDGKFGAKANTFTDFVACGRHLVATGRTAPEVLAARGGSAGGLLVGAVTNLAPDLFRAVIGEVPFVDPLATMLDPSLPLTVIEWEEWGDPLHDASAYDWIAGYSPIDHVADRAAGPYPSVLATAGLNDPRVGFHQPTKWVATLRDHGHGDGADPTRPVLLKVDLGAGHGGASGRYDAWRDEAFVLAFLLDQLGLA